MEKVERYSNGVLLPESNQLFVVEMSWGMQPVRLTAWRCQALPTEAPVTSVHIVAFHAGKALVVKDRKGMYGFPGGRLETQETLAVALAREVYEESSARLAPDYRLFGVLKIECTKQLPGRSYPHPYSYMAMYAGAATSLDTFTTDPAGIIRERCLLTYPECERCLLPHDRVLLKEALTCLTTAPEGDHSYVHAFLATVPPKGR